MKVLIQGLVAFLVVKFGLTAKNNPEEQRGLGEGSTILIEDFSKPIHKWVTMNDPIMGGKSKSALTIENGVAKFTGTCAIIPFLQVPGFITIVTGGYFSRRKEVFPDVTSCLGLSFNLKTNVDYDGYRISFGKERVPGGRHASGYKAGPLLDIPMDEFGEIVLPFDQFSSKWDEATGDIIVSCAEDSQYCPSTKWLKSMETISFWGEGVEGEVALQIQKITAVGCSSSAVNLALNVSASIATSPKVNLTGGAFWILCAMTVLGVLVVKQRRRSNRATYDEITQKVTEPSAENQLEFA